MANVLVERSYLEDIADSIRGKLGIADTYKPSEMSDAIDSISGGGITPTGTININSNGTHDVTQYASAAVNVPNSYTASDEGKVVNNGGLVAQSSDTVTENGTVDTTLINSLTVNVSGGGGTDYEDVVAGTATSFVSNVATIAPNLFRNQTHIKTVSLPNVTSIASENFRGASNLESVSIPNVTAIGGNAFMGCTKITTPLIFPQCNGSTNSSLANIANVPAIDILGGGSMNATFQNDSHLTAIILRANSLTTLSNINAFNGTPFASSGTGGTLYVPSALISSYQSASNWSTILGYATNSIQAIEGSIYENAYADGTPIA